MSIAPPRKIQWDRVVVSEAAAGNWGWIHQDLGIPIGDRRPGVPGPCPKKGGKDKFRLYDDYHETGGAVSNEDGSFANGFRLIVWWNNWDGPKGYSDAVNLVGDHLHSCGMLELPTNNGQSATPRKLAATTSGRGRGPNSNTNGKSLSRRPNAEKPPVNANKVAGTRKKLGMVPIDPANPLHREAAAMFAKAKPGITAETILSSGCEIGRWYDGTLVLSMPAYKSSDAGEPVHAEILYKVNGERFAAYGDLPERKVHLVMQKNSGDSWFIVGGTERLKLANFVVKVEGSTDALAMAGIVPDDWAVITNVCGAQPQWTGPSAPDFSVFAEKRLITIGDNDANGLGQRSARALSGTASHHAEKSFLGSLPAKFKDVRDWVAAGNEWPEFEDLFASAELILPDEIAAQPGEGIHREQLQSSSQRQTFVEGQKVKCGDRGNFGTVEEDDGGETVKVHFVSNLGVHATVDIERSQVRSLYGASDAPNEKKSPRTFAGIDASELASYATQQPDWLVDGIFTSDEPLLSAARSKGCKTLQFIDFSVALATGTKWMNHFHVPKRRKVLFVSGETNYRRTAKHIEAALRARGLQWNDVKGFLRVETIEFPTLPSESDQAAMHETVKNHGIELVICDPMYRGLSGVDSSRLNEVGSAIKSFQMACLPACMSLSHHVVKSAAREYGEPPSLEDMTGAGLAETAGQWWLTGRNSKYQWDGMHDLCIQYGGREGQAGGKRILFNERNWTFEVESLNEFIDEISQERQRQRDDAKRDAEAVKSNQTRVKILKAARDCKTPRSRSRMRDDAGLSGISFGSVFAELVREQTIVMRPYRDGANRIQPEGYLLAEFAADYDKQWNTS